MTEAQKAELQERMKNLRKSGSGYLLGSAIALSAVTLQPSSVFGAGGQSLTIPSDAAAYSRDLAGLVAVSMQHCSRCGRLFEPDTRSFVAHDECPACRRLL